MFSFGGVQDAVVEPKTSVRDGRRCPHSVSCMIECRHAIGVRSLLLQRTLKILNLVARNPLGNMKPDTVVEIGSWIAIARQVVVTKISWGRPIVPHIVLVPVEFRSGPAEGQIT